MSSPDGFWRNVATVLTGTAAAQAIPILASVLIARLYVPAEFGLFASWLGIVSVAIVAVTGRLEMALAQEPDGLPRHVAVAGTLMAIAIGMIALIAVLVTLAVLHIPYVGYNTMTLIAIPTVVGMAIAQVWQLWAAADGRFYELSTMRIVQAGSITGFQLLAATVLPTANGLACAQLSGVCVALLFAWKRMPLRLGQGSVGAWIVPAIRQFWQRHRRLPTFALTADVLNTAAAQLPVVIVASRFGAEIAGLLAMAMRALGAPISLLGSSVLDVFRRRAADSWRERGECRADYLQTFKVLALGALAAALVIEFFGESLFALVFGETWRSAGKIAVWLMPMFALRFVASPLSYVFYVANKQNVDLLWQISLLAMTLGALSLPSHYKFALLCYSVGYSLLYLVYLGLSFRFSAGARR